MRLKSLSLTSLFIYSKFYIPFLWKKNFLSNRIPWIKIIISYPIYIPYFFNQEISKVKSWILDLKSRSIFSLHL